MLKSKLSRFAAVMVATVLAFVAGMIEPYLFLVYLSLLVAAGAAVFGAVAYDWIIASSEDLDAERRRQNKSRGFEI